MSCNPKMIQSSVITIPRSEYQRAMTYFHDENNKWFANQGWSFRYEFTLNDDGDWNIRVLTKGR
jgi:hypothetical protein